VADVAIDALLVRALLREQHPDLADLPLSEVGGGWDNRLYRLGHDLVARLPSRAASTPLVENEQRWLPDLAPRLPLPIPAPIRTGRPGPGFPWAWSVMPWFDGDSLLAEPVADEAQAATAVWSFLRALHQPAPHDAPTNPWRGIPLAARDQHLHADLEQLGAAINRPLVLAFWQRALAVPAWDRPAVWIHGDLHPGNLVASGGRLSAVIDFGDLTSGDPATDLSIAWMRPQPFGLALRDAATRDGVDEATWQAALRAGRNLATRVAPATATRCDVFATVARALRHAPVAALSPAVASLRSGVATLLHQSRVRRREPTIWDQHHVPAAVGPSGHQLRQ
jgi:aminoglycoside phosphotransferase (APT) family kinase protein